MLLLVGWAMLRLDNFNITLTQSAHNVRIQEATVFLILLVTILSAVLVKSFFSSRSASGGFRLCCGVNLRVF
ncbi:hypothetical protein ALON55S_05327 [Alishewanella longhuensis]